MDEYQARLVFGERDVEGLRRHDVVDAAAHSRDAGIPQAGRCHPMSLRVAFAVSLVVRSETCSCYADTNFAKMRS